MAETRVYRRRHPERTDYYRVIESRFEELERMRPECFEQKYGYLRKEVVRAIYAFLDCGIPENGVVRVFCDGCGRDYFVAFSCRMRVACPSCSTKRSILLSSSISVSGPFGPRRLGRRSHRPTSVGRTLSTTSRTWTPTYRTPYTRTEPSSQHCPARKRAPENSRLGPYMLRIPAKPLRSTRNGPFRDLILRS